MILISNSKLFHYKWLTTVYRIIFFIADFCEKLTELFKIVFKTYSIYFFLFWKFLILVIQNKSGIKNCWMEFITLNFCISKEIETILSKQPKKFSQFNWTLNFMRIGWWLGKIFKPSRNFRLDACFGAKNVYFSCIGKCKKGCILFKIKFVEKLV